MDDRGNTMIANLVEVAISVCVLVAVFAVIPLIGIGIEDAVVLQECEHATGTLNFTGNTTDGELVNISTDTYEFDLEGNTAVGNFAVDVSGGKNTTILAAGALATSINTNDSVGVGATNSSTVVTLTADACAASGNAITTTETITNAAFGSTTLTGGADYSEWNPAGNPNLDSPVSIWEKASGLIALAVIISILVLVIGAIITMQRYG